MASPRHGRAATIGSAALVVLVLVVLATVGVAIFSDSAIALRLAVAGALSAGVLAGTAYDAALREARNEATRERLRATRATAELAAQRIATARAVDALHDTVAALRSEAATDGAAGPAIDAAAAELITPDLWTDADDAPTVVDLDGRRTERSNRGAHARASLVDVTDDEEGRAKDRDHVRHEMSR